MIKYIVIALIVIAAVYFFLPGIYSFCALFVYSSKGAKVSLKLYEKAYKTGRASAKAKINYAIISLRNAEPEKAEKLFDEVVASEKANEGQKNSARQYRCLVYIKQGRAEKALEEATELLKKYKNSDLYAMAGYAMSLTDTAPDKLLELCTDAYEYNADNRDIADNYAVALIRAGKYFEALEICDDVTQNNRYFPEGHFHKAQAYAALGKFSEAAEELDALEDCDFKYMTTISEEDIDKLRKLTEENLQ